jgi:hypothetical protein
MRDRWTIGDMKETERISIDSEMERYDVNVKSKRE